MLKNAKIPTKPKPYKNAARPEYKWIVHYPNSDFSAMTYKLFKCKNEASDFIEKITPKCDEDYSTKMLTIDKAREYLQAEELLKPFNTNILTVVKKFISTTQVPIANEQPSDFLTGYLANLKIKSSKAHYTNTQQRLLRFISYLPPKKTLGEISTVDIQKFLDTLCQRRPKKGIRGTYETSKPVSLRTQYHYQNSLSGFFEEAKKKYGLPENPCSTLEKISVPIDDPKFLSVAQAQTVLTASHNKPDIQTYVAIAMFCGLRKAEMGRLTNKAVYLGDREIVLSAAITKTKQRRVVKIPENAVKYINPQILQQHGTDIIFDKAFFQRLKRWLHKLPFKWTQNAFRHTAATYYLAQTKNEYETARQMGHSITILKQHYAGLAREKEAIAFYQL